MHFATRYAIGGIGLARFSSSHPAARSLPSPTPIPNSAAPIIPKQQYPARRYFVTRHPAP